MNIVIVEDNSVAVVNLMDQLQGINSDINVIRVLDSVKTSVAFFEHNEERVDLIFMDIELKDGMSFNIFERVHIAAPVVFVTGYDSFMLEAFKKNGIGYIIKPYDVEEIKKILENYQRLKTHISQSVKHIAQEKGHEDSTRKGYFICRRSKEIYLVRVENVVLFYSDDHVVFIVDSQSKKHIIESVRNLNALCLDLDPMTFFRVNRRFIININYIQKFVPVDRVKLSLEMTIPLKEEILIGQESAKKFREWLKAR